ncbi:DUF1697 domain-containing protein [Massilia oculi]|uniref:DUF1697 domain-containing protein n=1 Tax=Massilia hydrophila TaxID=3044279 RepID=A0ABS7YG21_9BURK|nr:DUF1697 domain-containing protein [Massilia oculi]MCA1858042.1 DUF1697 domain-containing protein [Massilia oculi]
MNSHCYIALLRGINVGRAKRIAMADLRMLAEGLGYTGVRSILNSGNLVFRAPGSSAPGLARELEDALVLKLGVAARVFVLGCDELAAIVAANPLLDVAADHARLLVFLLPDADRRARLAGLAERDWNGERLAVGEAAAYVWFPEGILESAVAVSIGKILGDTSTSRNWNTVMKLHALCKAF